MIDGLTIRVPIANLDPHQVRAWSDRQGYLCAIDPTGQVEWAKPKRESLRSDSHGVVIEHWHDCLKVQGSPARVMGTDNVFGSDNALACARAMCGFASGHGIVEFGDDFDAWTVSRLDVTENYDLGAPSAVRQALTHLRMASGGRYAVRTQADTCYWSPASERKSGKAYAKGPHLEYLARQGKVALDPTDLALAHRLLRLELALRSKWWREDAPAKWWELTGAQLAGFHRDYFEKLIGSIEVTDMTDLRKRLDEVCDTPGRAQAAYYFWALVRTVGIEEVRNATPRSTYYKHVKALMQAGLSHSDFTAGAILPFRSTRIDLGQPVQSWAELRRSAA